MTTAMAKIIQGDRCLKNLQSDIGKEFYNGNVQKLLKKHNIYKSLFYIFNEGLGRRTVQSHVETRYVETQFTRNGNYKLINLLPCLVSKYNTQKH